jgi:hypothetical protein
MAKSKFLRLPNGQIIRPFMISSASPTDAGVAILGSSNDMIGFISIDEKLYNQEIKAHICEILANICEEKSKEINQVDWIKTFDSHRITTI